MCARVAQKPNSFALVLNFYRLPEVNRISCAVWAKKFTKKCDPRAEFLPCFFAQPKPALFVVACLFICFYIPFVIAFSFLKMPTGVFPMKNLETTYIFFNPHRILFKLLLFTNWMTCHWHVQTYHLGFNRLQINWKLDFIRSHSIQSFKLKLDAVVFLESEIVINRVLKQPWCTKIRQCTNVDEFSRQLTNKRCEARKLEVAQSTLAKLVKALFEMERIFQEKDGKGKTPLFVGRGVGGGGLWYSLILAI